MKNQTQLNSTSNYFNLTLFISVIALIIGVTALIFNLKDTKKIAYIDSSKLMTQYQGMIDARKKVNNSNSKYEANLDTLTTQFQNSLKEYEMAKANMSVDQQKKKEADLQYRKDQLIKYQQSLEQKSQEDQMKETQNVVLDMNNFVTQYGKLHNYTIIFSTTTEGNIVYANDVINITDEVVEGLNNKYNLK